ncbi:AmmeMemoRadiSam system protein B [Candidatus Woesebacteria bacterium]|nr:AmmeMemoRadiSam system protein B [Candidatus Woesebacteria bacterium]
MKKYHIWLVAILAIGLATVSLSTLSNKAPLSISENTEADQELLESFYTNKAEYESAYELVENHSNQRVTAGIVSHHFLAKDLIADFFAGIEPSDIETVYVVGPDHFSKLSQSDDRAVTSLLSWQTPYGILEANQILIEKYDLEGDLSINNQVFKNEHAIYTLVPFIKRSIPTAKIVPIVLATNLSDEVAYELGQKLDSENAVLILSSDFAHQVSEKEAKSLDAKSLVALNPPTLDSLDEITNDCRQCIALLAGYLSNQQSTFELRTNKSSADFGPARDDDLTSYVSAYYLTY